MKNGAFFNNNRFSRKFDHQITHITPIKFEIYSFIDIVTNYYNLQPNLIDRIKYIFNEIWKKHYTYFNNIRYENTVLGVMIFVVDEFYKEMCIDDIPIDVTDFVIMLYGKENMDKNLIQIYVVYQNILEIFNKSILLSYVS